MDEVGLTQELVRINSENPPGNEKDMARFIYDYLQDLKIDAEILEFEPKRFNVIASIGKGDGLVLNGHMDTVPSGDLNNWKYDPFEGKIIGNKLYGRGSADMKGGIASILAALSKTDFSRFGHRLVLLFVGGEETGAKGSSWLVKNRRDVLSGIECGVIAEFTYNNVMTAQKGISSTRVKFKGKSAHGSKPWLGDNAIMKAVKFVNELEKLSNRLKKKRDDVLGYGTLNVGKISGGTKINMVPDYCEVEIDRRLVPGDTPNEVMKQYRDILKKLGIDAQVEFTREPRMAMKISEGSEIVKMIKDIVKTKSVGETGYTEAELYYRETGKEFVSFGPGNSEQAHAADEFVEIPKLREATYLFENLIKKWCF